MMDAPTAFVFAEAAVKNNRPNSQSIFKADPTTTNFKPYYADPGLLQEAVNQLKKAGFQVSSADKFGVSFFGTRKTFEEKFKVKLKAVEVETVPSNGNAVIKYVIDKNPPTNFLETSQTDFKEWLDGVVLQIPMVQAYADVLPAKGGDWQLYFNEIPDLLNWSKFYGAIIDGTGVKVVVIDSGYFRHPFLNTNYPARIIRKHTERVYSAHYQALVNYSAIQGQAEREVLEKYEDFRREPDPNGHGTSVVANLLAVAPKVEVLVIKELIKDGDYSEAFGIAIDYQPDIICCSFGKPLQIAELEPNWPASVLYRKKIRELVEQHNIMVIYASGNYNPQQAGYIHLEPQFGNVFSVGGAYYNGETLTASNAAHGFPDRYPNASPLKGIPDTCGIVGPQAHLDFIIVPQPPTAVRPDGDWEAQSGTSLAAPQIAGVCALIKQAFPAATPAQMKEILQKTAEPIVAGTTLQNQSMNAIDLGNGLHPGLADIKIAVLTAMYMNAGVAIDEAIVNARDLGLRLIK